MHFQYTFKYTLSFFLKNDSEHCLYFFHIRNYILVSTLLSMTLLTLMPSLKKSVKPVFFEQNVLCDFFLVQSSFCEPTTRWSPSCLCVFVSFIKCSADMPNMTIVHFDFNLEEINFTDILV